MPTMGFKLAPRAVECWRKGLRFWLVSGRSGAELAEPGEPIVYAYELELLADKTDQELDAVLLAKAVFPGARVIETTPETAWDGPSLAPP